MSNPLPHDDSMFFRCPAHMVRQVQELAHAELTTRATILRQAVALLLETKARGR